MTHTRKQPQKNSFCKLKHNPHGLTNTSLSSRDLAVRKQNNIKPISPPPLSIQYQDNEKRPQLYQSIIIDPSKIRPF